MLLLTGQIKAQDRFTSLALNIGIPMGDTKNFVEEATARGLSFDYNKLINENLAVGGGIAWEVFYQEMGQTTTTVETSSVTGLEYRYMNSFPLHLTGTWFFTPEKAFTPYAGLGVGTIYDRQDKDIGIYRYKEDAWHLSFRPEVGFQYDINNFTGLRFGVRYNQAFAAGNIDASSYLAVTLGVVWIR